MDLLFKNSEIKSEFKAKGLCKAAEVLDVMKLSKKDRTEYESYIENRRVTERSVKTSWVEGKIEGKNERNIQLLPVWSLHSSLRNKKVIKSA